MGPWARSKGGRGWGYLGGGGGGMLRIDARVATASRPCSALVLVRAYAPRLCSYPRNEIC